MIYNELIEQKEFIYDISYICETGGRPINEDSVVVEHDDKSVFIAVADGLGAHGAVILLLRLRLILQKMSI